MNKEDISVFKHGIPLNVGDGIIKSDIQINDDIDIIDNIKEVVYIDYLKQKVVVCGGMSARSRAEILTFNTIASGQYKKIVEYNLK